MARTNRIVAWWPEKRLMGSLQNWERTETITDPPLEVRRYPMQRGYSRSLIRHAVPYQLSLLKRLRSACEDPANCLLICSTPFYASVAEEWLGPVIYYATGHEGFNSKQVMGLDRRMCRAATLVCPSSKRLAEYLQHTAGCDRSKITIIPNATRESNIAGAPLLFPGPLPTAIAQVPRPIAGIIGDLSGNMDWELLERSIEATPWLNWVLLGPTDIAIDEKPQSAARTRVMKKPRCVHFVGSRRGGELQAYARAVDVAVLPYRKNEPTYSGSSAHFYEHLAACRPMVGTRGCAELLEKPPLIELVDTPEEMATALLRLRAVAFHDGQETARWEASRAATWEERVRTLSAALR